MRKLWRKIILSAIYIMGNSFFNTFTSGGRSGVSYSTSLENRMKNIVKSNDWFYKPGSLSAGGPGRTCSRGILSAVKRRT